MASNEMERRRVVSSEQIDKLIKTSPPDQMIVRMAELIRTRYIHDMSEAKLEEKLTEQQIYQLLMTKPGAYPVVHLLIWCNPTSAVKLLKQITNEDQFSQLIFMKDDVYQLNSLSWAVMNSQSDVVRYIYTRLNEDNLYKLLRSKNENGYTALHYASSQDYPLNELLEPFTDTQSHELLSIRNNAGQTAAMIEEAMRPYLKRGASTQDVDQWFESTPSDVLIERLMSTMEKWGHNDVDRFNLGERLTIGQIVEFLTTPDGQLTMLHYLVMVNPLLVVRLLTRILDEDQFLQLISMKDGKYQQNSLSRAARHSQSGVVKYIYTRLNEDDLYKLLSHQDKDGDTAVHFASERDYPIEHLLEPFTNTQSHELLSVRNNAGQTVLSHFIHKGKPESFQSLIRAFSGRQSKLLDLAAIQDTEGNTSFHYAAGGDTSDYLMALIQATLTLQTREKLITILAMKNVGNEIVKPPQKSWMKPLPANRIIYQWALESIQSRQYLLFGYPKVLIISNEADREGAEEEAEALVNCFQSLDFKVDAKTNRTKRDMLEDLKEASKSKTGLIVAIMSHGEEGFILDNYGERIDIKEIEECMNHHSRITPRCLILQCCQTMEEEPNGNGLSQSQLMVEHSQPSTSSPEFELQPEAEPDTPEGSRSPAGSPPPSGNPEMLQRCQSSEEQPILNDLIQSQPIIEQNEPSTSGSEVELQSEEFSEREIAENLQFPVDAPTPPRNPSTQCRPYAPTRRHFCVLQSTVTGETAKRNAFIPAVAEAIMQAQPNDDISEVMDRAVYKLALAVPSQKPCIYKVAMFRFCLQNVLPLVLKRAGFEIDGREAAEATGDRAGAGSAANQGSTERQESVVSQETVVSQESVVSQEGEGGTGVVEGTGISAASIN